MDLKTTLDMVIGNWTKSIPELHISPTDFYSKLDRKFQELQIPDARISRKWWKESRLISAKREYFRIERYRVVFDICCVPFGKGSFISSWLCIVPFCLSLTHIVGMFALGTVVGILAGSYYPETTMRGSMNLLQNPFQGLAIFFGVASVLAVLFHLPVWWFISKLRKQFVFVNSNVWSDLLCGMTLIGPLLLTWADSRPTYYQLDSAGVFHEAVHGATMEVLGGYMVAQDLQILSLEDRAPVMREFLRKR